MPVRSTQAVVVAAQPAEIMAVVADFPSYPDWAEAVVTCEVLSAHPDGCPERVRFVLDAGMVEDDYVLAYEWPPGGLRVDWALVSSRVQRSHDGSYLLRPAGPRTEVTCALSLDLDLPTLGVFRRQAERVIMDTALKSLKRRVESAG
jgi:hypothetical protein